MVDKKYLIDDENIKVVSGGVFDGEYEEGDNVIHPVYHEEWDGIKVGDKYKVNLLGVTEVMVSDIHHFFGKEKIYVCFVFPGYSGSCGIDYFKSIIIEKVN